LISMRAPDGVLVIVKVSARVDGEHKHTPSTRKKQSFERDAMCQPRRKNASHVGGDYHLEIYLYREESFSQGLALLCWPGFGE
jgi:hypothetical protein